MGKNYYQLITNLTPPLNQVEYKGNTELLIYVYQQGIDQKTIKL